MGIKFNKIYSLCCFLTLVRLFVDFGDGLGGPDWLNLEVGQEARVLQQGGASLEGALLNLHFVAVHADVAAGLLHGRGLFEGVNYHFAGSLAVELLIQIVKRNGSEREFAAELLLERKRELLRQIQIIIGVEVLLRALARQLGRTALAGLLRSRSCIILILALLLAALSLLLGSGCDLGRALFLGGFAHAHLSLIDLLVVASALIT